MPMRVRYTVIDGEIVSEVRDGVRRDYVPDSLGNTIALTDGTTFTDTWEYWPYGEVRTRTGTTATPFQFVGTLGYYTDSANSRIYVRARTYRQGQGRWQTVDPLWPGESAYGYVRSAPQILVDPQGEGCPPVSPPWPITCTKAWNKYIYDWCNCYPNLCDYFARTYYTRCAKPGPGPGDFGPPPDGTRGEIAPRPRPQPLPVPNPDDEPCFRAYPCKGKASDIGKCVSYARGISDPPWGFEHGKPNNADWSMFDCYNCCRRISQTTDGSYDRICYKLAQDCYATCDAAARMASINRLNTVLGGIKVTYRGGRVALESDD